jgi:predicted membrane-bound spermidine synthase
MDEAVTNGTESDGTGEAGDPTFVRRLAIGMALVVALSAPTVAVFSVASKVLLNPASTSVVLTTLTVPMMSSGAVLLMIYGFWYALAAAFAHTSMIGALACRGADSPWIATGLGCVVGLIVPFVATAMNTAVADGADMVSKLAAVRSWPQFALTGTVMGWLNWRVAIRPRRLHRDDEEDFTVVPSPLRAFAGIVRTSLAAGPTVALMTFGGHVVGSPSVAAPLIIGTAAFFGIFFSLPASVINAAILSVLVRFGLDDVRVSILSGALIGLAIPLIISNHDEKTAASAARITGTQPVGLLVFAATGALMGGLYWMIAVRPQRRRRLAFEAAAMREFVRAVRETGQERSGRIPWDGRIPPEER